MRRTVLIGAAAAAAAVPAALPSAASADLAGMVDPFVGTAQSAPDFGTGGGAGNTFPGAAVPFGMVQFSPDTLPGEVNFAGGYSYVDSQIRGFSLTHLSGAGCAGLQDVPLLPTAAPVDRSPMSRGSSQVNAAYVPSFSHEREQAAPGDYRVQLDPGTAQEIGVELTATRRTGRMRLKLPPGGGSLLVNAGGSAMANDSAEWRLDPERSEINGTVAGGRFCYMGDRHRLHVVLRFDRRPSAHGTWDGTGLHAGETSAAEQATLPLNYKPIPGGPASIPGEPSGTAQAGAYFTFSDPSVEVRVGLSYTSVEQARANLIAEGAAPFEEARAGARREWNAMLGRLRVQGGAETDRRRLATALYHALLMPTTFSDADGSYRGMDGQVHHAGGWTKLTNVSGWDIYRSLVPLLAIIAPERARDIVLSLLADAEHSGRLPRWPVAGSHASVMNGDPADPIIAGAYAFGVRGFDVRRAHEFMRYGAEVPGRVGRYVQRPGIEPYVNRGYVPRELDPGLGGMNAFIDPALVWGSAATTLEYALADFSIALVAAASCDRAGAVAYMRRAGNWRNVLAPATRRMAQRSLSGAFLPGAPEEEAGFTEGSAEQYTWFVPHDVEGLVKALGGTNTALARLDGFFSQLNAGPASGHAFLGNEPSLLAPYIYHWLGRPDRAHAVVRQAMSELYPQGPGGLPGNDDLGTLSAWWILNAIGIAPVIPGTDVVALGAPLFERVRITLGPVSVLEIRAPGAQADRPYVASMRVGRKRWQHSWARFAELRSARRIVVAPSAEPTPWGTTGERPPSYPPGTPLPGC